MPLQAPQNSAPASATSYYTVQFLTTATLFTTGAPELEGISDFQTVRVGKNYAYTTGRFATMQEAANYCSHLKQATSFKDAWAYQSKGQAATQAAPQPQQQPVTTPATKQQGSTAVKGLTYRVQFCTASKQMKAGDPDLQGISDIHSSPAGNGFVHSAGDYKSRSEAQKRCNTIRKTTKFRDAFVIAIYNGERITLEQAKALEQNNKGK